MVPSCKNTRLCCKTADNVRNGVCNADTNTDPECLYDFPDCQPRSSYINEICDYAKVQMNIDCTNTYDTFGGVCKNLKKCGTDTTTDTAVTQNTDTTTLGSTDFNLLILTF